ncbi:MAG: hypothetical protein OHK0023_10770 [Anaerolineae bacterium]
MTRQLRGRQSLLWLLSVYLILLLIYQPTFLAHPAGGDNPYMDDVGEAQVTLNVWGTLHHTGYPLWTILGNLFTSIVRGLGISAALAPTMYALLCGFAALGIFYALIMNLSHGHFTLAAALTLILGVTRTVWFHNVAPEVYGMSFAFQIGLIALALWRDVPIQRRLVWLALVGGFGVAHHRMVFFLIPGLILAIFPEFMAWLKRTPRQAIVTILLALPIGLLGFLPYLYLPMRAQAGAIWVYGDPSTLEGFWHEFTGAEAAFLMRFPDSTEALAADIGDTFAIIGLELVAVPAIVGLVCLLWMLFTSDKASRQMAWILLGCGVPYLIWLFLLHRVVMPQAVAMPIVALLLLAIALAAAKIPKDIAHHITILGLTMPCVLLLIAVNSQFIQGLISDQAGVEAIRAAQRIPRGGSPVLMLPWGPRYTAVAFSKYVTGENAEVSLAKHTANFKEMASSGQQIYTLRDTFYRFPKTWWDEQFGRVSLRSAGYGVVEILPTSVIAAEDGLAVAEGVALESLSACRSKDAYHLRINWQAIGPSRPDYSVFVHLLSREDERPLTQADSAAPVYGWYPSSMWQTGELVADEYRIATRSHATRLRFGLYTQKSTGEFENFPADEVILEAIEACPVD